MRVKMTPVETMKYLNERLKNVSGQIEEFKKKYENLKTTKEQLVEYGFENEIIERVDGHINKCEDALKGLGETLYYIKSEIDEFQRTCKHENCEYMGFGGHRDLWKCKDCGYILRY